MSQSYLYQIQLAIEQIIENALPENISVFSKRKGDITSTVQSAVSRIGVAVAVSVPAPIKFSNSHSFKYDELEMDIAIMENPTTKNKSIELDAYDLVDIICKTLHQARPLDRTIITLHQFTDISPSDNRMVIFNLTIRIR